MSDGRRKPYLHPRTSRLPDDYRRVLRRVGHEHLDVNSLRRDAKRDAKRGDWKTRPIHDADSIDFYEVP